METAQLVQVLIVALQTCILLLLADMRSEITRSRERLHKLESGSGALLSHIQYMNTFMADLKDADVRLAKLEVKVK